MDMDSPLEQDVRELIIAAVAEAASRNGGFLTREQLSAFELPDGRRRRLIDTSRGIWNPRELPATLSVVSSPTGPYADREVRGGLFHYSYRAGSAEGDNRKLRAAGEHGLPIILLRKIEAGVYVPVCPVYVVHDDRPNREFILALDEGIRFLADPLNPTPAQRRYAERVVRARLHQPEFRGRVILAYDQRCTICQLHHADLLDAAHIVEDVAEGGLPVVPNGLSLCKIHHAAYDRDLLGISPDFVVQVHPRLLREENGPMLRHGLQEMEGRTLLLPHKRADRPDQDRLDERFRRFRQVSA